MIHAARLLSRHSKCYLWECTDDSTPYSERIISISDAKNCQTVILPIPAFDKNGKFNAKNNISAEQLFTSLPDKSLILGGKISKFIYRLALEHGHRIIDYGSHEEFNLYNAQPTAEAALLIAMQSSQKSVAGSNYIIAGFGRIGRALASKLKALGGAVTICARRKESLVQAECEGYNTMSFTELYKNPPDCEAFFNTVPSVIIEPENITNWNCPVFIELASAPGGFSCEARKLLYDRYISALSLPGKYFPKTAGEIIYKTVLPHILPKEDIV